MEFTLAFGPKPEFSFSFKFFSTTHGYILAHIALKVNICFPLGKKFARLTHHYYNIFMDLNEKLNSGFGPNARVNSI